MGTIASFFKKNKSNLPIQLHFEYSQLSFLNMAEVHILHCIWRECAPEIVDVDPLAKLPYKTLMQIDQLKCHPFADRLIFYFSPNTDGSMSFDDFLNMYSMLSGRGNESEVQEFLIVLVFQIFDDDEDGYLTCTDCVKIIKRLLRHDYIQNLELIIILQRLLGEADIDGDGRISFDEFAHMMHKSIFFNRSWRLI